MSENNHWTEDYASDKKQYKEDKNQEVTLPHTNVESWLSQHQTREDHGDHLNSYNKGYSNYINSHSEKSEIWEKKPEKEMLDAQLTSNGKANQDIKRTSSWLHNDAHILGHGISVSRNSNVCIKQENAPTLNAFVHSMIQDSKIEGPGHNSIYIPDSETATARKNIRKTAHAKAHSQPEKSWDENKNKSSESTPAWAAEEDTAPQAPDRTTGDAWSFQTMSSVMENSHYHPIKQSGDENELHPESESYNHSESLSPPTKQGGGREGKQRTASVVTQSEHPLHPTAPSDGGEDREHAPSRALPVIQSWSVRLAAWLLTAWPATTPPHHPTLEEISTRVNLPRVTLWMRHHLPRRLCTLPRLEVWQ
ncbi:GATA-binding factor A [Caerostris extrusa]|uniref:GATA-binding factor A n=1 Tax=Caerostris extrusa TaxID=172846 RepID=A0AAV4YE13_CAEEX|nr:GATA-binding factor A [Caerostris extrusa]